MPPSQNGKPAPSRRQVSTSAALGTTPSARTCAISSASASSTASVMLLDGRRRVGGDDDLVAPVRVARERRREREALAEGGVQRLEDVVGHARPDQLQQHRGRHRQAEPQNRLVRLGHRVPVLERLHEHARHPRQHAVDDEGGSVATSTPRLRSALVTAPAVASVTSSLASVRTSSTSGISATGLKKCMPTRRSRMLQAAAHLATESADVLVARTHSGPDDALDRSEDLLLHGELLEHRFEHEVAVLESVPARRARDEGGVLRRGGRLAQRVERLGDPGLVDVAEHDRHLEPLQKELRELGRHQAGADDSDPRRPRAARPSGCPAASSAGTRRVGRRRSTPAPRRPAGARRTRLARPGCPPRTSSGLLPRSGRAPCRAPGRCRGRPRRASGAPWRRSRRPRSGRETGLAARGGPLPASSRAHATDCLEQAVGRRRAGRRSRARAAAARRASGSGASRSPRSPSRRCARPRGAAGSCVPPQPGNQAQEALREAGMPDAGGDGPGVAVEGELEAAAEAGAVDGGDRHEGQRPQPAEQRRARPASPRGPPPASRVPRTARCPLRLRSSRACPVQHERLPLLPARARRDSAAATRARLARERSGGSSRRRSSRRPRRPSG